MINRITATLKAIYWTYFKDKSRTIFREALDLDVGTWHRAQGWALWKTLVTVTGLSPSIDIEARGAKTILAEILKDETIVI